MAFAEDLSPFFDVDEFAVAASIVAGASGSVIFDTNGLVLEQMGVQTSGPSAIGPAAEWASAAEGQSIDIAHAGGTVRYAVRAVTPLDDGALVLFTLARS